MVRKEIAEGLHWQPKEQLQRIWRIAERLLQDQDEDVRKAMAFQFHNLSEMPQLFPLIKNTVENDPSPEVRREALGSMAGLLPPEQVVAFYGQVMSRDSSEEMAWSILSGLRTHREHPAAKKMLLGLANGPHEHVGNAAREELTN